MYYREPKPSWLRKPIPAVGPILQVKGILRELGLHTVCESAMCPNIGECFSKHAATFMILGDVCTRNCPFCAVSKGRPLRVDDSEPGKVAEAVFRLGLKHVVVTSVDRDDLQDYGASHFARTITAIKNKVPRVIVEVLIPDFQGSKESIELVVRARPTIINHNIETVPRLHPIIKPRSDYQRSLALLRWVKCGDPSIYTKSGLMLGFDEEFEEVIQVMEDLREIECDILTLGQYLPPSNSHIKLREYVHPNRFQEYKSKALEIGFKYVASAPFVRSSFNAAEFSRQFGSTETEMEIVN